MSAPAKPWITCTVEGCTRQGSARKKLCGRHEAAQRRDPVTPQKIHRQAGDRAWTQHAACHGHNPEIWFPTNEAPGCAAVKAARRICDTCPVRAQCLEWAMTNQEFGIAGGLTADERAAARRNGRATTEGT